MRTLLLFLASASLLTTSSTAQIPYQPFPLDWSKSDASVVDLSHFLQAPAGKDGWLRAEGGRIVLPDGKRFRGWGVNLAVNSCFPDKELAPKIAADLARMGFNVIRFHHTDTDWGRSLIDEQRDDTQHLDAENLDRFDFMIAELKKRGIYAALTMNVHRKYKAGDGVRDWQTLAIGKGATYFNPRLIELQHDFARKLLTHRNPYTGNEYRHEPAVAIIEMTNENSLIEAWCGWRLRPGVTEKTDDTWQPIPDSYARELDDLFNAWLVKNVEPTALAAIRREAGVDAENGRMPRLVPKDFTPASEARFQAEARFYMALEAEYFAGWKRLLRDELGCKAMLVGSNDHNDGIAGYAHIAGNATFDIIDGHGYWEHPKLGAETWIKNTPMVNDPLDSTVVQFARTPLAGKPFTISETNHPWPHKYACEGYPILTAYALLHDWDGIYWFDWEYGRLGDPGKGIAPFSWFDVSMDPVKIASLAACGAMWHRADVRPAESTIRRGYAETHMIEALRLFKLRPFFTPGFALTNPLIHGTRFEVRSTNVEDPDDLKSFLSEVGNADGPRHPWDQPPGAILSDTGELAWRDADRKQGLVTIDTPRTQAIIGLVKPRWWEKERSTRHLQAEIKNEFCALVLTSLDGEPIEKSARLLLTATARAANTGAKWHDDFQTLADWGKGPVRIEPVTGTLKLRGLADAKGLRLRPLTAEGAPMEKELAPTRVGNDWQLPLGEPATIWYLLEPQR